MKIKRIEHVAIAVNGMTDSKTLLEDVFGLNLEYEEKIGSTQLAMYPVGQTYIELLEGLDPESPVANWIAERGQSLFHLCFEVEDIEDALVELRSKGIKLLDETPRTGHGGAKIAFLNPESTNEILIELAEMPAAHV